MGVVYRATDLVARPPGGAEADRARARARTSASASASCAEPRLAAVARPPERDPDLRGRRARRAAVPGDALRRGQRPQDAARARAARSTPERALRDPRARSRARSTRRTARGLVHRDVKPANVLLDEDEHAYLTDFGVTKQARRRRDRHRAGRSGRSTTSPRADPRRAGRRAHRRLRARVRALRVPGRRAAVPPPDRRPRRCGRTCTSEPPPLRGRPGARPGAAHGAREGARTSATRPARS